MDDNDPHYASNGNIDADAVEGYRILQSLGRGSTGLVYRAVQLAMQREVALKILSPELAADAAFVQRFRREAQMAGAVHHANVITCYDAGESGGYVYMALELLEGGNLQEVMRREDIDEDRAVAIMLDCAQGLEGIHASGLTHGDITPPNIFIGPDGTAKVGDLGLARSMIIDSSDRRHFPASGARIYLAPEVTKAGYTPDVRSDIFSLGAVFYHLLTGEAPFLPESPEEDEWTDEEPTDPRSINPDVSPGVAAVVRKCLSRDPQDRYASPVQLREDLERVAYRFAPLHARSETRSWSSDDERRTGTLSRVRTRALESSTSREAQPPPATSRTRDARAVSRAGTRTGTKMATKRRRRTAAAEPLVEDETVESPRRGGNPLLIIVLVVLVVAGLVGAAVISGPGDEEPEPVARSGTHQAVDELPARQPGDGPDTDVVVAGQGPDSAGPGDGAAAKPPVVELEPAHDKPAWAHATGVDEFGTWASVEVAGQRMKFRWCEPGRFLMGSPKNEPDRVSDEAQREVTISKGFWLGETELSQDIFLAVTEENPSHFKGAGRPVEFISWTRSQRFLQTLTDQVDDFPVRLPTEAEWEYACRAGQDGLPASDQRGWTEANSEGQTHAIATGTPNAWGFYNMLGNVMEWTADAYGRYDQLPSTDPHSEDGLFRVARGGAWSFPPEACRPATRTRYQPRAHFFFLGLRLAVDGE